MQWNPWHGCHKISPGCQNCYVYRMDAKYDRDSSQVVKTQSFDLPIRRNRAGQYRVPPGEVLYTCFSSDFFVEDADAWRPAAWAMMRERQDLSFFFITKRIHRFSVGLPADWGEGYQNVAVSCTVENQDRADYRLPLYFQAPIRHRFIICEPLLGPLDLRPYLKPEQVVQVVAGGESGPNARVLDYRWILSLAEQCQEAGVAFCFKQTGARILKDGKLYRIPRKLQHSQARKAGLRYTPPGLTSPFF